MRKSPFGLTAIVLVSFLSGVLVGVWFHLSAIRDRRETFLYPAYTEQSAKINGAIVLQRFCDRFKIEGRPEDRLDCSMFGEPIVVMDGDLADVSFPVKHGRGSVDFLLFPSGGYATSPNLPFRLRGVKPPKS